MYRIRVREKDHFVRCTVVVILFLFDLLQLVLLVTKEGLRRKETKADEIDVRE